MTEVKPYLEFNDAITALDNGGRFYNLWTKADDGIISTSELAKAGGQYNDKQNMILFFEMSISSLSEIDQQQIISKLEPKLKETYLKYKPIQLVPNEVDTKGILASNVIITGIPKLIDSKSTFSGFVFMPMQIDGTTSFMMIPLSDIYDVYEIRDDEKDAKFLIAHAKGSTQLSENRMKVGGILKEFKPEKNEDSKSKKFLEITHHMKI